MVRTVMPCITDNAKKGITRKMPNPTIPVVIFLVMILAVVAAVKDAIKVVLALLVKIVRPDCVAILVHPGTVHTALPHYVRDVALMCCK